MTLAGGDAVGEPDGAPYEDLSQRPGFLIRRLHQIHLALFAEECSAFDVTPVQYSVLTALVGRPAQDQVALALIVGIDRATLAAVLARLAAKKLIRRSVSRQDRRNKLNGLTEAGRSLLAAMDPLAQRAHGRTIEALPLQARAAFVTAMMQLVEAGNAHGRAPLSLPAAGTDQTATSTRPFSMRTS